MAVSGRKYGRGKYGAKTYDLGVVHVLPPWLPETTVPPSEVWVPVPPVSPWCEQPPSISASEIWKPVTMPVN